MAAIHRNHQGHAALVGDGIEMAKENEPHHVRTREASFVVKGVPPPEIVRVGMIDDAPLGIPGLEYLFWVFTLEMLRDQFLRSQFLH